MKPEKLTANQLLAKHGPAGSLIRTLQRYALWGWMMFGILFCVFFVLVVISTFSPRPIIAVDQSGKVLGAIEYLKPETRTDEEVIAASKRFTTLFLSLNSATIFDDYAEAMNLMGGKLKEETEAFIRKEPDDSKTTNYLGRIAAARARSWIEFQPQEGVRIVSRRELSYVVRLNGNIVVDMGGPDGRTSNPFDITVDVEAAPRNSNNTAGLIFVSRKDN